jgi:hypothetical protein
VRPRLGYGVGAVIPHLPGASPDAVVVGLDRTRRTVASGPRAFPLLVGDAVRVPFPGSLVTPIGSMPWQSARLHASVGATSSENGSRFNDARADLPRGLSSPLSYTHVVAATGSRLVFVAGQVSDDADGN